MAETVPRPSRHATVWQPSRMSDCVTSPLAGTTERDDRTVPAEVSSERTGCVQALRFSWLELWHDMRNTLFYLVIGGEGGIRTLDRGCLYTLSRRAPSAARTPLRWVATRPAALRHPSPLLPLLPSGPGGVHSLSSRRDRLGHRRCPTGQNASLRRLSAKMNHASSGCAAVPAAGRSRSGRRSRRVVETPEPVVDQTLTSRKNS